ncbi:hypothetical protein [Candidatus Burkholderia verschuerenii]|uniref:hypothetical protein n=1 Tax=Candidatus Burkholderia verschuerenii TaxID=242163 RepID=UPI00067BD683|nr:hypothetical protein [Candidatus Burkholderia verschuerenii]
MSYKLLLAASLMTSLAGALTMNVALAQDASDGTNMTVPASNDQASASNAADSTSYGGRAATSDSGSMSQDTRSSSNTRCQPWPFCDIYHGQ